MHVIRFICVKPRMLSTQDLCCQIRIVKKCNAMSKTWSKPKKIFIKRIIIDIKNDSFTKLWNKAQTSVDFLKNKEHSS